MDNVRLFELCKILNEKIDACAYYSGIGFQNALGDFEIDEDAWEENKTLIDEFEKLVQDNILFKCDLCIINFESLDIDMYKHIRTIQGN